MVQASIIFMCIIKVPDGSMTYVNQTTTNLPELKASGDVSVFNAQCSKLVVLMLTISNITAPHGLSKKVLVPTWTEADGQDDIIWHTAERQSDGSYKVTVPTEAEVWYREVSYSCVLSKVLMVV